jgi:hypothetical protein
MPVILASSETESRRISGEGQFGKIPYETPISKNSQIKMNWRFGSSGRMSALQMQSPEFKLQSHTHNKSKMHSKDAIC